MAILSSSSSSSGKCPPQNKTKFYTQIYICLVLCSTWSRNPRACGTDSHALSSSATDCLVCVLNSFLLYRALGIDMTLFKIGIRRRTFKIPGDLYLCRLLFYYIGFVVQEFLLWFGFFKLRDDMNPQILIVEDSDISLAHRKRSLSLYCLYPVPCPPPQSLAHPSLGVTCSLLSVPRFYSMHKTICILFFSTSLFST